MHGVKAVRSIASFTLAVILLMHASIHAVANHPNYKTADGLAVYLGVVPAAMIRGLHEDHPEEEMHSGIPRGRHAFHVMVAVFDTASGEQIRNATVEARVTPLGLAGVSRPLEPMNIADTVTYGNYFTLREELPYRISISITRPEAAESATLDFSHDQRKH